MKNKAGQYTKLGIFVIAGAACLVVLLYMIGKNRNLFDKTILVKTHLNNVQGLMVGNNVRFSGIEVGTVKQISFLNDSVIEVSMVLKKEMDQIIKKNARVSIGTEGFVGYKLVNIKNLPFSANYISDGDLLLPDKKINTDELLETVGNTIAQVENASIELNKILQKLNHSDALWALLNDKSINNKIHYCLDQIKSMSQNLNSASTKIANITNDMQQGNGLLHELTYDSTLSEKLSNTLSSISKIGDRVDTFETKLSKSIEELSYEIQYGAGVLPSLIHDTAIVKKLNVGLDNVVSASNSLSANMEALKHNFLFRKYFKKLDKQKKDTVKIK